MSLLVIFGAGASYDSVDLRYASGADKGLTPPLADQLFDDRPDLMGRLLWDRPILASVAAEVRAAAGRRDVEDVLAGYQSRASDERVARQIIELRYYLRSLLFESVSGGPGFVGWYRGNSRVTNHAALIEYIERQERSNVIFVTFNYDLLIEYALHDVLGSWFPDLDSYAGKSKYSLLKLHGSVDWGRIVGPRLDEAVEPEQELLRNAAGSLLSVGDEYSMLANAQSSLDREGNLCLPAIAVPIREKDKFECPADHARFLEGALPEVSRVICIGWRGGEDRFLKMLRAGLRESTPFDIVSSHGGYSQTRANLENAGIHADFRYLPIVERQKPGKMRSPVWGFSALTIRAGQQGSLPSHDQFAQF